jgi:uncharacterized protein (DUF58 family)
MRRLREGFYRGPDWIDAPDVSVGGYKSPTVMLAVWCFALLLRAFSPTGALLGALTLAIGMYSTILPRSNSAILLFALLALFLVDFATGLLLWPRLSIKRQTPERVRAGSELSLVYHVFNRRRAPAWDVLLDQGIPTKTLKPVGEPASIAHLGGRSSAKATARFQALKRGVVVLPRPMATSSFPFDIFQFSSRSGQARALTVQPDFQSLESFRTPGGPRLQKMGITAVSKVGESMEFHGCREFRVGDDPRKIHWLGTARTGEPVVKEFQEERLNRVALVLDTHCAEPGWFQRLVKGGVDERTLAAFEASVSLTAAIAEHLAKGEFIIDLFATGRKAWRFKAGRSLVQLDDLLDILACVEASFEEPFERVDAGLLEELGSIGAVVFVLSTPDAKADEFRRRVLESGAGLRCLLVSDVKGPDWTETFSPEDVFERRVVRL